MATQIEYSHVYGSSLDTILGGHKQYYDTQTLRIDISNFDGTFFLFFYKLSHILCSGKHFSKVEQRGGTNCGLPSIYDNSNDFQSFLIYSDFKIHVFIYKRVTKFVLIFYNNF